MSEINKHQAYLKICKILIDSDLKINEQIFVTKKVYETLIFCKETVTEMSQLKLEL